MAVVTSPWATMRFRRSKDVKGWALLGIPLHLYPQVMQPLFEQQTRFIEKHGRGEFVNVLFEAPIALAARLALAFPAPPNCEPLVVNQAGNRLLYGRFAQSAKARCQALETEARPGLALLRGDESFWQVVTILSNLPTLPLDRLHCPPLAEPAETDAGAGVEAGIRLGLEAPVDAVAEVSQPVGSASASAALRSLTQEGLMLQRAAALPRPANPPPSRVPSANAAAANVSRTRVLRVPGSVQPGRPTGSISLEPTLGLDEEGFEPDDWEPDDWQMGEGEDSEALDAPDSQEDFEDVWDTEEAEDFWDAPMQPQPPLSPPNCPVPSPHAESSLAKPSLGEKPAIALPQQAFGANDLRAQPDLNLPQSAPPAFPQPQTMPVEQGGLARPAKTQLRGQTAQQAAAQAPKAEALVQQVLVQQAWDAPPASELPPASEVSQRPAATRLPSPGQAQGSLALGRYRSGLIPHPSDPSSLQVYNSGGLTIADAIARQEQQEAAALAAEEQAQRRRIKLPFERPQPSLPPLHSDGAGHAQGPPSWSYGHASPRLPEETWAAAASGRLPPAPLSSEPSVSGACQGPERWLPAAQENPWLPPIQRTEQRIAQGTDQTDLGWGEPRSPMAAIAADWGYYDGAGDWVPCDPVMAGPEAGWTGEVWPGEGAISGDYSEAIAPEPNPPCLDLDGLLVPAPTDVVCLPVDEVHHEPILLQGVAVWNAWRRANPLVRPNLRGAYLNNLDLRGADLHDVDLRFAFLFRADLRQADLSLASLLGADLIRADLGYASLWGAALAGAYLSHANLAGADLTQADLRGVFWQGAILAGAMMPDGQWFEAF